MLSAWAPTATFAADRWSQNVAPRSSARPARRLREDSVGARRDAPWPRRCMVGDGMIIDRR